MSINSDSESESESKTPLLSKTNQRDAEKLNETKLEEQERIRQQILASRILIYGSCGCFIALIYIVLDAFVYHAMFSPPYIPTKRISFIIVIFGAICLFITFHLSHYTRIATSNNIYHISHIPHHNQQSHSGVTNYQDSIVNYKPISSYNTIHTGSTKRNVIFPRSFEIDANSNDYLINFYKALTSKANPKHHQLDDEDDEKKDNGINAFNYFTKDNKINLDKFNIFKYQFNKDLKSEPLNEDIKTLNFHPFTISIFNNLKKNLRGYVKNCHQILSNYDIEISDPISKETSLEKIVRNFELENSNYYQELKSFFTDNPIKNQLRDHTIEKHWYRLAGTSVWLEQYGVHFMISRIIYTPSGIKNKPVISLMYAQLFDEKWQEINNVELIIPTNNPDLENINSSGINFKNLKFPQILPTPFYHDSEVIHEKYYGPEDPRILLAKNKLGYEEPVIIYNSWHRKIAHTQQQDKSNDRTYNVDFNYYRSMYICWPWQFQRGKINVEELPNHQYKLNLYNRISELKKIEVDRAYLQKNWTPFTSYYDRVKYGYDKYIYFIYKWEDIQVLKCKLSNINDIYTSDCKLDYSLNKKDNGDSIGSLRGGSQLINLNQLLDDYKYQSSNMNLKVILDNIPQGREIWVGFARAHLRDCGCGHDFYRPNLVTIIKDDNNKYKISHMSPFISLDVPVGAFDDVSNTDCKSGEPNVFIPNGIGSWSLNSYDTNNKHNKNIGFDDYLTMIYSIADNSVDIIHIKGLLKAILTNQDAKLTFESSSSKRSGFNNDNIKCALEDSHKFCAAYGLDHAPKDGE
ncbi:hypothetical protein DFJ63DRAFT_333062 [Scheffersomyces coipomensis]|uniref:uncharacterized protein n=1 Tax=Scheffersomyces coipomensis TaxID=1788519 RepID=UPI00315CB0D7